MEWLSLQAPFEHAFVGSLSGELWDHLEVMAAATRGDARRGFRFDLRTSPWHYSDRQLYMSAGASHHLAAVQGHLEGPHEAYASEVVHDSYGRPAGLICALSPQPVEERTGRQLLRPYLRRVADVIERGMEQREQLLIWEASKALGSEGFLRSIVRNAGMALRVRWAFVSELLSGEGPTRARTLVFWSTDGFADPMEYSMRGTPCEDVYSKAICFVARGVCEAYPEDELLAKIGVESYLGIPFHDARGEAIAHMGIMHDRPLPGGLYNQALFRIFATLAGAELVRQRAEEESRAMERKLMETQQRESLGMLAGTIAHDFNNLLVGVTGNVGLALDQTAGDDPIRTRLEAIEATANRAADLARQMLAYSGKSPFVMRTADLSALLQEMLELIHAALPKSVRVGTHLPLGLPAVRVDETQIRQIAMNLVLNAAEALDGEPGTVELSAGSRWADADELQGLRFGRHLRPDRYVLLQVRDDGPGMDQETRAQVFSPFFTTKGTGRGLGLAAVQNIVRRHEAGLAIDSEPGRGTTVRLYLPQAGPPVVPAALGQSRQADPATLAGRGWRALIVDDDPTVREVLENVLNRLDFVVDVAHGGQAALERAADTSAPWDLAIVDLTMPDMNGVDVIHGLRKKDPDLKVILMSGYDQQEVSGSFLSFQATRFLQKPFGLRLLKEVMAELLAPSGEIDTQGL
jgi:signal transduction histidine kinase/ActR/RegA family two-component response regulator